MPFIERQGEFAFTRPVFEFLLCRREVRYSERQGICNVLQDTNIKRHAFGESLSRLLRLRENAVESFLTE